MKILYIIRGVSNSGKSFTAEHIAERTIFGIKLKSYPICTADDYFYDNGNYNFDANMLHEAHKYCFDKCENSMSKSIKKIIVNNTSTTERDVNTYIELAKKYGYKFVVLTNEKWHGFINSHGVTDETIRNMEMELLNSIKLVHNSKFNTKNIIELYKFNYVNQYVMINKEPKLCIKITLNQENGRLYFKFDDGSKEEIKLSKQYQIKK